MTQHVFFLPSWMESREACPEPRHGAYQHLRHVDLQQLTQETGHYVTEGVDLESMWLAVNMFRKKTTLYVIVAYYAAGACPVSLCSRSSARS